MQQIRRYRWVDISTLIRTGRRTQIVFNRYVQVFHSHLKPIRFIIIPIILRNIKLNYVNDTIYKKVHVRLYETDLGDQSSDEAEKCYCRSEDSCLKRGLFDLTKCMGVPIYATLPHFLRTDESYMKQIDGLTPDEVKHGLRVYFEPVGTMGLVS